MATTMTTTMTNSSRETIVSVYRTRTYRPSLGAKTKNMTPKIDAHHL